MEGFALILVCLAIIVQFYGVFSGNDFIGKELNTIHRDKRSHEYDHFYNSTNTKPELTDIEVFKKHDTNKRHEIISPKAKPKVVTNPKKENIKIEDDKQHTERNIVPKSRKHFIEDIDEESPVHCSQLIKPRLNEGTNKATSENTPFKGNKTPKKENIESIPKKLFPENVTKESSKELIPQLITADPKSDKNATVSLDVKEVSIEKRESIKNNINSTKDQAKDKPIASVRKSPIAELDGKKQGTDNSITEIKEHKYEEEIVRYHPTKSCQPGIKRHWESSQNFNPQFSNPYAQAMNSYQGSQTDPYQRVTYNKNKYFPAYTCTHYMDKSNGNYFYANFDMEPYKLAKEKPSYQYANCDRIRKVWLDRNTKIRTASNPNEYMKQI